MTTRTDGCSKLDRIRGSALGTLAAALLATIPGIASATLTLATDTDPAGATVAPGASNVTLDSFTLTGTGGVKNYTVTTVTLALTGNADFASVTVTCTAGGTGTISTATATNPVAAPTLTLSPSLGVTGTASTCSVTATFDGHSTLSSQTNISVSAYVSATNPAVGAGTDSANTFTVDNLAPSPVVSGLSGSAGNTQVVVSWTTEPSDADFIAGGEVVVLRRVGAAPTGTPVEGTDYLGGETVGDGVVACVAAPGVKTCTAGTLTNGSAYYFKAFARDAQFNFSATSASVGPYTPSGAVVTLTLADFKTGTSESTTTPIAPNAKAAVDTFALTSSATSTVTGATVTLTYSTGTPVAAVGIYPAADCTGTPYVTASSPPAGANALTFTSNISATTTQTNYYVCVTAKDHALFTGSPTVTGRITALATTSTVTGTDPGSATLTLDNTAPTPIVSGLSGTAGSGQVNVAWTTEPSDADFATGGEVIVLVKVGSAPTGVPTEGVNYSGSETVGDGTVGCVAAPGVKGCPVTGLNTGTQYYFKAFARDVRLNYSATSLSIGPFSPTAYVGEGDTGDNSTKPSVSIINPAGGPVGLPLRVQARVSVPTGGVSVGAVTLQIDGANYGTMLPSARYGTTATSGVWEIQVNSLTAGVRTLQVKAFNTKLPVAESVLSRKVSVTYDATKKGDGNLLVRDNSSQLCSDCHAGVMTHSSESTSNKKGSWSLACRDCHTSHLTRNIGLIRELITPPSYSQDEAARTVVYRSNTGGVVGGPYNAANNGVCQVCHTQTAFYTNDGLNKTHETGGNCIGCHDHKKGMKGVCFTCHGLESRTAGVLNTDEHLTAAPPALASPVPTGQVTTGDGHMIHLDRTNFRTNPLLCDDCHATYTHRDGAADVDWGTLARSNGTAPTPITGAVASHGWPTTPTCTNWCHGQGLGAGGGAASFDWRSETAIGCSSCHGAPPPVSSAVAADHPQNTACANCHGAGYSTGGLSVAAKGTHLNGTVQKPNKGCSSCHGDLTVADGTIVPPGDTRSAPGYGGTGVDTTGNALVTVKGVGAHRAHFEPTSATGATAAIACAQCHVLPIAGNTDHADAGLDFNWGSIAKDGTRLSPSYSASTFKCTSVYCHSNARPLGGTDSLPDSPAWTNGANLGCTSCHQTAIFTGTGLSPKHQKHVSTYGYACVRCHVNTVTSGMAIVSGGGQHVDGTRDVNFDATGPNNSLGGYDAAAHKCSNTYCHSPGVDRDGNYSSGFSAAAWDTSAPCASCHGYGTTMVNTAHGAHTNQASVYGVTWGCQTCHYPTTQDGATIASTSLHVNALSNVDGNPAGSLKYQDAGNTVANSCTTYCHSTGKKLLSEAAPYKYYSNMSWTTPTDLGGCNDCHGAYTKVGDGVLYDSKAGEPNYDNDTVNTYKANTHNIHIGGADSCYDCHKDVVTAAGGVIANPSLHMDGKVDIAFDTSVGTIQTYIPRSGATPPSCNAVSCHLSNPLAPAQWGGIIIEPQCTQCHMAAAGATNGDVDNYKYKTDPIALIDPEDYNTYGHGRMSPFTDAGMSQNTGIPGMSYGTSKAQEGCYYCHLPKDALSTSPLTATVQHGDPSNPFRLANTGLSWGKNGNCLICHATNRTGFDPDAGGPLTSKTALNAVVTAAHYGADHLAAGAGKGGEFCWDCHDPHGDQSYSAANKLLAYMIQERPIKTHETVEDQNNWGVPDPLTEFTTNWVAFNSEIVGGTAGWDPLDYVDNNTTNGLNGVCQVCHTNAAIKYYLAGTTSNHMQGALCTKCHTHNNSFKEATGCNDCHYANPTASGEHALHVGAAEASAAYGVTTPASTATQYGYNCGKCHTTVATNHYNDNAGGTSTPFSVNVGFDWTSGATPYTLGTATNDQHVPTGFLFKTTTGTCATYCHSNGDPLGATAPAIAYQTPAPTWTAQAALPCTACHGGKDTATPLMSPTHAKHINANSSASYQFTCRRCHTPSINTDATVIESQHVDGDTQDVGFDAPNTSGTYVGASRTCQTVYCHSNGMASPTYPATPPTWTDSAYGGTCNQCHGIQTTLATATHDEHVNQPAVLGATGYGCVECHNTVVSANTTLINPGGYALHVDGAKNVGFPTRTGQAASGAYASTSCSTNYCHSTGRDPAFAEATYAARYTTVSWGGAAITCTGCHGKSTSTGAPDGADGATLPSANSHAVHTTGGATDCEHCHTGYVTPAGTVIAGSAHTDGVRNVAILAAYDMDATATNNYTAATKTCSSTRCHGGTNTVVWGNNGTLTCSSCHGTSPRTIGSAVGVGDTNLVAAPPKDTAGALTGNIVGPHQAHVVPITTAEGQNYLPIKCSECHAGTRTNGHMNGTRDVSFADAVVADLGGSAPGWSPGSPGTCTSTYCHGDKLAAASRGSITTWTWGAATADCGSCHGLPPNPTGASHGTVPANATACAGCHSETVDAAGKIIYTGTGASATTKHIDGTVQGGGDCISCHGTEKGTKVPRNRVSDSAATLGQPGDDFIRPSRHVSNGVSGTGGFIVTNFDCILCHAEGDLSSTTAGGIKAIDANHGASTTGTTTIDLRDVDTAGGTTIAVAWPGSRQALLAKGTASTVVRNKMDGFCMGCHDLGGAAAVAVNKTTPASGMLYGATAPGAGSANALKPFNVADTLANAKETTSNTVKAQRTRVVDVKSQFNTGNAPGKSFASHHNLNQFTKRYTSAFLPTGTWTAGTVTMEGKTINTERELAGLHCSDCHLNESNAHGSRSTWFMLSDKSGADAATTGGGTVSSTTICSKCHAAGVYENTGTGTGSNTAAHQACAKWAIYSGPGGAFAHLTSTDGTVAPDINCLGCHGGFGLGSIHGTNGSYQVFTTGSTTKMYRFMGTGASYRYYSPTTTATVTDPTTWNTAGTGTCYLINSSTDTWGGCTSHQGGKNPTRGARTLEY